MGVIAVPLLVIRVVIHPVTTLAINVINIVIAIVVDTYDATKVVVGGNHTSTL